MAPRTRRPLRQGPPGVTIGAFTNGSYLIVPLGEYGEPGTAHHEWDFRVVSRQGSQVNTRMFDCSGGAVEHACCRRSRVFAPHRPRRKLENRGLAPAKRCSAWPGSPGIPHPLLLNAEDWPEGEECVPPHAGSRASINEVIEAERCALKGPCAIVYPVDLAPCHARRRVTVGCPFTISDRGGAMLCRPSHPQPAVTRPWSGADA
jgi:hypothetical protein